MAQPTHQIATTLSPEGTETARVLMSSESNTRRCHIEVPPDRAIPVIFVPGIMGSPLLSLSSASELIEQKTKWAWFPDKALWMANLSGSYANLSPAQRKRLLNPTTTRALSKASTRGIMEPENSAEGNEVRALIKRHVKTLWPDEAIRRGWASVMVSSYGSILNFLEAQLRFIATPECKPYPGIHRSMPRDPSDWGQLTGYVPLNQAALGKASKFQYPVYAVGYNWLESNDKAADHLADCIRAIMARCEATLPVKCRHGVILVTHSMGGLVARMCAKRNPDLIQGVVHGVQPALGAATAYRRVRAGWDWKASWNPKDTVVSMVGANALAERGHELMPVFGNAAGPLELLPNKQYGQGWLKVICEGKEIFSAPSINFEGIANPYSDIYLNSTAWWRLMLPGWLDPPEDSDSKTDRSPSIPAAWKNYSDQIRAAEAFHNLLADYYHPNTYSHYGADEQYKAFHRITWKLTVGHVASQTHGLPSTRLPVPTAEQAMNLRLVTDNMAGRVTMINDRSEAQLLAQHGWGITHDTRGDRYMADLQDQDEAGDETVPAHSAAASGHKAKFVARMTGFGHQDSYKDAKVQAVTLYSILRIGATAIELPPA